jgi:hypothetical protein
MHRVSIFFVFFIWLASSAAIWDISARNTNVRAEEESIDYLLQKELDTELTKCLELQIGTRLPCMKDSLNKTASESIEFRDLQAQEGMEYWAKLMAAISFAGMFFTGITIVLLLKTLDENRRATDSALDIFVKEQRPWLTLTPVVSSIWWDRDFVSLSFSTRLKNVGNSPSIKTMYTIKVVDIQHEDYSSNLPDLLLSRFIKKESEFSGQTVFPGQEIEIPNVTVHVDAKGTDYLFPMIAFIVSYRHYADDKARFGTIKLGRVADSFTKGSVFRRSGRVNPEYMALDERTAVTKAL